MVDSPAEKHESGCTCPGCRIRNDGTRRSAVVLFCLAATFVAVVWGSIRLGAGMGLSWQVVLLAPVAIATAGALLYLLISWRKPCADKDDRARAREQVRELYPQWAHEPSCTCLRCRVRNDGTRDLAVWLFCLAATFVAVVWGSIRLGAGMGLSWQVVLLAPVAIATAGALLYLLISWRKPCADKDDRARHEDEQARERKQFWRELLAAGEVSQAEYDEQAKLGFPPGPGDIDLTKTGCMVLLAFGFALLALVVTFVAWGLSKLWP